jgi:branched-chain amino acid transport system substrate-binding protein
MRTKYNIKWYGLFSAILLVAAGLWSATATAQDTIKVGIITDRVGNSAAWAKPIEAGLELALSEINGAGGVLGKKIELVYESDQSKPDVSATKARKLIDAGVVAILSITNSPSTQQAQTVTMNAKMVHMTPANSAGYLTTKLKNPYFFQMGPLGSTQIRTLMAYNKKNNFKRVALVKDNSGLGTYLGKIFRQSLEAGGTKVVAEQTIEIGSTDAIPQMQKVRAAKPDAIYHSGIVVSAMATFFKAYHQLGLKQPVLGSFNLSIPKYLEVIPGMMEGVAFIDAYDPDKAQSKAFAAAYKKKHGKTPFSLPAYGYDGLKVLVSAIKRAGSTNNEKLRSAMAATKGYVGVLGAKGQSVNFTKNRAGFSVDGAVVRIINKNTHGPVVHSGTKN